MLLAALLVCLAMGMDFPGGGVGEISVESPPATVYRRASQRLHRAASSVQDSNLTVVDTIVCTNETDLYTMLYSICNQLPLCRELYYLESGGGQRDFHKFKHQLSLIALFNNDSAQGTGRLFVSHIWPAKWVPHYLVQFNDQAPSCAQNAVASLHPSAVQMASADERAFVYAVSNMMMTYKQYISNEHYCNDHNERLLFDQADGGFHCECRAGKLCNNSESTYNAMLIFMGIAILLAILLLIFVSVYNTLHYSKHIDGKQ